MLGAEFANADFCLDLRTSRALGVRRTSFGQLSVPESERFSLLGYGSESSERTRPQRVSLAAFPPCSFNHNLKGLNLSTLQSPALKSGTEMN